MTRIALAAPRIAMSLADGIAKVDRLAAAAAGQGATVVCFPEAYLPGLRGLDFAVPDYGPADEWQVLNAVSGIARTHKVAIIIGMELVLKNGRAIAAAVFDARGAVLGVQTKNQLDPSEEPHYVPGHNRQMFEIDGLRFGVAICHEGWRYPETVRWAACRGAHIVFHPQLTGSDRTGTAITQWGAVDSPYYEKAMMMRSRENTIYFASVNYAMRYQESATSLIDPDGECQAFLPYGEEGVLVADLDLARATGFLAHRFAPDRYGATDDGPATRA